MKWVVDRKDETYNNINEDKRKLDPHKSNKDQHWTNPTRSNKDTPPHALQPWYTRHRNGIERGRHYSYRAASPPQHNFPTKTLNQTKTRSGSLPPAEGRDFPHLHGPKAIESGVDWPHLNPYVVVLKVSKKSYNRERREWLSICQFQRVAWFELIVVLTFRLSCLWLFF